MGSNPTASGEWEQIISFPKYQITRAGQVRTIKTGRIKKSWVSVKGYPIVYLNGPFGGRPIHVSQLVMHTFSREIPSKEFVVRYKDKNKLNVHFDNLYYCSCSEKLRESWASGKYKNKLPSYSFPVGPTNPKWKHGRRAGQKVTIS